MALLALRHTQGWIFLGLNQPTYRLNFSEIKWLLPAIALGGCGQPDSEPSRKHLVVIDFRSQDQAKIFREQFVHEIAERYETNKRPRITFVGCAFGQRSEASCTTEALAHKPTLVYTTTTTLAKRLREQDARIPILFSGIFDPRKVGLVDSLAHPGNRMTGFVSYAGTSGKRIEYLTMVHSSVKRIGVLQDGALDVDENRNLRARSARDLGVVLVPIRLPETPTFNDLAAVFCSSSFDAFDVPTSSTVRIHHRLVIEALEGCRKPAIFLHRDFTERGGLMSYGPVDFDYPRKAAEYVRRIDNSTDLGDIPVELQTKFWLSINIRAADSLAKNFSKELLLRADEIIRVP